MITLVLVYDTQSKSALLRFLLTNAPLVKVIGNPISDGIVFKNELTHCTCPCLRRKKVEKSQAILEYLMTFRSSISTGKLEPLLVLMFVFFSSVWFMQLKLKHEQ